ncbi:DUF1127 domain-containing protein [Pelagibius sp. 7325]|uniref:DUF1127 domain-containing protein n=1 Tax=Pelagibius sp. 7325 TaxID=3131994 RepID=UPI0030EB451F
MTTLSNLMLRESAAVHPRPRLRPIRAITQILADWQARHEHRSHLRAMPAYLLQDIGLSAEDVMEETEKPFWRP